MHRCGESALKKNCAAAAGAKAVSMDMRTTAFNDLSNVVTEFT